MSVGLASPPMVSLIGSVRGMTIGKCSIGIYLTLSSGWGIVSDPAVSTSAHGRMISI